MPDPIPDTPSKPTSDQIKRQLRADLRRRRQQLGAAGQVAAAQTASQFSSQLPGWPQARRVALYLPQDGEVDTSRLAQACRESGIELFLPVINSDKSLAFARWTSDDGLQANRYGIPEPPAAAERCPVAALDFLFLPLVAWDCSGTRLGMGGGYYDRTLAGISGPTLVGLGHSFQQVKALPREQWDIPLEFVISEEALHRLPGCR